jgi:hypothetical protein
MKTTSAIAFLIGGAVGGWAAVGAAPAQEYPGQPTKAEVWIQNRADSEAIPVSLRSAPLDAPVPVQVVGTQSMAIAPNTVVRMRAASQPWEYQQIVVETGGSLAEALAAAGQEGWETTGVFGAVPGGTAVLLKRPQ